MDAIAESSGSAIPSLMRNTTGTYRYARSPSCEKNSNLTPQTYLCRCLINWHVCNFEFYTYREHGRLEDFERERGSGCFWSYDFFQRRPVKICGEGVPLEPGPLPNFLARPPWAGPVGLPQRPPLPPPFSNEGNSVEYEY